MDLTQIIQQSMTTPTLVFLGIMALFTVVGFIFKRHNTAAANLVTVLGILGTFIGIWYGLAGFDTQDIQGSIPQLLEGLKLAFTTSIAGMLCSVLLRTWGMARKDKAEAPEEVSIVTLANLLTEMRDNQKEFFDRQEASFNSLSETLNQNFGKVVTSICGDGESTLLTQIQKLRTSFNDKQDELKQVVTTKNDELIREFHEFAETMAENNSKALIEALSGVIRDFNDRITEQFGENFKHLNEAVGNLLTWQQEYKEDLNKMMEVYRSLVESMVEIRDAMSSVSEKANSLVDTSEKLQELLTALEQLRSDIHAHLEAFAELKTNAKDAFPVIEQNLNNLTTRFTEHANGVFAKNQEFVDNQAKSCTDPH